MRSEFLVKNLITCSKSLFGRNFHRLTYAHTKSHLGSNVSWLLWLFSMLSGYGGVSYHLDSKGKFGAVSTFTD